MKIVVSKRGCCTILGNIQSELSLEIPPQIFTQLEEVNIRHDLFSRNHHRKDLLLVSYASTMLFILEEEGYKHVDRALDLGPVTEVDYDRLQKTSDSLLTFLPKLLNEATRLWNE